MRDPRLNPSRIASKRSKLAKRYSDLDAEHLIVVKILEIINYFRNLKIKPRD